MTCKFCDGKSYTLDVRYVVDCGGPHTEIIKKPCLSCPLEEDKPKRIVSFRGTVLRNSKLHADINRTLAEQKAEIESLKARVKMLSKDLELFIGLALK